MSSMLFKPMRVVDGRLNVQETLDFAVYRGPQNITPSTYPATSASNSQVLFQIQVPSEQVVMSRQINWNAVVDFQINYRAPANLLDLNYGQTDALGPFPLHSLCSTMTCTVNNNSVSVNMKDILPFLLQMHGARNLQHYAGYTPTMPDNCRSYSEVVPQADVAGTDIYQFAANPLGSVIGKDFDKMVGRGGFKLLALSWLPQDTAIANGTPFQQRNPAQAVVPGDNLTLYGRVKLCEPLLMSPFIFGECANNSGVFGLNQLNFAFILSDANRWWRTGSESFAEYPTDFKVSINKFVECSLEMVFLTPPISANLFTSTRNTVPYMDFVRYQTTYSQAIAVGSPIQPKTFNVSSNTIQLNVVSDMLLIGLRKQPQNVSNGDADFWYPITDTSITYNNQAGILSSASQRQLFDISKDNGLQTDWETWSGLAQKPSRLQYTPENINTVRASPNNVSVSHALLSGGFLVLRMGKDVAIGEEYYAPSSIGSFSLQVNVTGVNYGAGDTAGCELVIIACNSGIITFDRGSSSTYTALLNKELVVSTKAERPTYSNDIRRLVGGSFLDVAKSAVGSLAPLINNLAPLLVPLAVKAVTGAGASGAGVSGAGVSGAGKSGGKLQQRLL